MIGLQNINGYGIEDGTLSLLKSTALKRFKNYERISYLMRFFISTISKLTSTNF